MWLYINGYKKNIKSILENIQRRIFYEEKHTNNTTNKPNVSIIECETSSKPYMETITDIFPEKH